MKKIILALSILLSLLVGTIFLVTQDVNAVSFDEPAVETVASVDPSIETSAVESTYEASNETEPSTEPTTTPSTTPNVTTSESSHEEQNKPLVTETEPSKSETKSAGSSITNNDVYDTVYATTEVNVRVTPDAGSMRLGTLNAGASISRTGLSNDGWTEVIYEGQRAYMCSQYLSVTPSQNDPSVDVLSPVFEDTNETVYTTTSVNVRSGPGTGYAKLGMYYRGNSVIRIGISDNGWSKISYNGSDAYICSEYLSSSKPESVWKDGMYGRLTIPSVGINVGLYYCTSDAGSTAQSIVNAVDSAAYINQVNVDGVLIADHNNQGFDAMKKSKPYETYAYIDFGSYTQTYVCTAIGLGHNYDNDMVDWNGVSLNYDYISGGLAMYTCNENWQNITISYWQPV